jgi:chromosome segregation protein
MILSKINIHGFKSFAKKVELQFDGKITSVVGPNGCGKTNVVDAIRWGLGEQRPSVLRTDRMENIIFGGARSSKPLGMAEVSVTFDNSKHILPIDYSEVVITRRLYRSGESEYLLNKTPVRLKDIKDLLMDTGIGADAYSVIELKMIEDILSDKAEDRRKLLEEAAGVTKYKDRLRTANRKLDATQSDLLRVNDIIQEVDRNVNSLKRQVQRAKRYKELEEESKVLELSRSSYLLQKIKNDIKPLQEELISLKEKREGRASEISKDEADAERIKADMLLKEKILVEERERLSQVVACIHQREGDIRVSRERISSSEQRIQRNEKEITDLNKRIEEQSNHLDSTTRDREALQVKITSTGRIFNNKKKELEVFQQGLNLKRLELNGKKKTIIDCLEEMNRLGSEEMALRAKVDNTQGRMERLDEEDAAFRESRKKVQEESKSVSEKQKSVYETCRKLELQISEISAEEENLRQSAEKIREQFYLDQGEAEALQSKLSFLKTIVESREGMSDGAKKLLKDKPAGLIGAMADLMSVKPEYQQAVETALGEAGRFLIAESSRHALDALKMLKVQGGGNVSIICLDRVLPDKKKNAHQIPEIDGVIGLADKIVECGKEIRAAADYLLSDVLIVKDLAAAEHLMDQYKNLPFRIVTLDGHLIAEWGIHQARLDKNDSGVLGRLDRIKKLERDIEYLKSRIEGHQKLLKEKEKKLKQVKENKTDLDKQFKQSSQSLIDIEKRSDQIQFEIDRADEGLGKNTGARKDLLKEIENSKVLIEKIRPRMDALSDQREELEISTAQIQAEVDRLEEDETNMEEEVHRLNLQLVRLKGDAKNLDYDIERSGMLVKELGETVSLREEETLTAAGEIKIQQDTLKRNTSALGEDFLNKEKVEKELQVKEADYQVLKEQLQACEQEMRQVRKDRELTAEKIHQREMNIADLDHQARSIRDRIWEVYEEDLSGITPPETIDLEEAEINLEDIKRKMKALGGVNMQALEEYEEQSKRLAFLSQQRDDLWEAEKTLKETILKINQTARERFEHVFIQVRANFQKTFSRFFQGGEADLRLPADDDPLEAQIEITARPAGKHFRDLSLLSGGERALTAISLLFALYLVKPSPFCILDEVDAPLDDANVDRFTRVLNEFAENTQFVMVTHNKSTMRASQALYGVTMEEQGVSKIVSVRFDDDEKMEELELAEAG